MSTNRLDEEFPSLLSLPAKKPTAKSDAQSTSSSVAASTTAAANTGQGHNAPSAMTAAQQLELFDIKSTESFTQTELTSQDLGHAVTSTMNFVPDTPYDMHSQLADTNTEGTRGYPQYPNMRLTRPEFFKNFDLSTLFFIFFYSPGTPQQFFAGKELKKREWMFNTHYQTWFRRLSEPTEKTATYEVAQFQYFDHSNNEGWCMRERSFKFEYEHLGR